MLFNDRAAPCGFQSSVSSAESASKTDCGCRLIIAMTIFKILMNGLKLPLDNGMQLNHLERTSSA
jgi:hypothetical protein